MAPGAARGIRADIADQVTNSRWPRVVMKLRSASFSNVQVLSELLPASRVADLPAILGSMFFVVGDIDR